MKGTLLGKASASLAEQAVHRHAYITTSWDDGHILDFRVAALLSKYGVSGTFYIPREAPTGVMSEAQIRELSASFEIGAHTMHHIFLDSADDRLAGQEIRQSRAWVEDVTGERCTMFCPPGGKFSSTHLEQIEMAGFEGMRSVELLSMDWPRKTGRLQVMPTTLQAHPHGVLTYARNAIKRRSWGNLWNYILFGRARDWDQVARSMVEVTGHCGGVFHLWGHSWELEENGQWERLEEALRFLGEITRDVPTLTNGEVCRAAR